MDPIERNLKRFESIQPIIPAEVLEEQKKYKEEKTTRLAREAIFYEKERREERRYEKRWRREKITEKRRDREKGRARERRRERAYEREKMRDVERNREEETAFTLERQHGRDLQRSGHDERERERSLERAQERELEKKRNKERDEYRADDLERAETRKRWRFSQQRREKERERLRLEERRIELEEKSRWNKERKQDKDRKNEIYKEREHDRANERADVRLFADDIWNEGRRERLRAKEHEVDCHSQRKLDVQRSYETWKYHKQIYEKEKTKYKENIELAALKMKNRQLGDQGWDDACADKRNWEKEQERDKLNREEWQARLKRMFFRFKNPWYNNQFLK